MPWASGSSVECGRPRAGTSTHHHDAFKCLSRPERRLPLPQALVLREYYARRTPTLRHRSGCAGTARLAQEAKAAMVA